MRYHKGHDAWGRGGYEIPDFAVAGSSDCGDFSDSPAKTANVEIELKDLQLRLKNEGISSRLQYTNSSNACMQKRWVVVKKADFEKAKIIAEKHLEMTKQTTRYIHDAKE